MESEKKRGVLAAWKGRNRRKEEKDVTSCGTLIKQKSASLKKETCALHGYERKQGKN